MESRECPFAGSLTDGMKSASRELKMCLCSSVYSHTKLKNFFNKVRESRTSDHLRELYGRNSTRKWE